MMLNATRSVARAARPAVAARLFSASAKVGLEVLIELRWVSRPVGRCERERPAGDSIDQPRDRCMHKT
jgi:hypothetical protein